MLTLLLILIPALTAIAVLATKNNSAKQLALIGAVAELVLTVTIWKLFENNATSQFGFSYQWIQSLGISFSGGIDGISLLLVILTALLTPLIILSTFRQPYKNASAFYALILFMQAALVGVFTATDAFLFYFFFEAALKIGRAHV